MNYGQAQTVSAHAAAVRKQLHILFTLVFILLLVSASYLLSGCAGVVSGSAKKTTTVGSFQATPTSVNFGQVIVGKQATEVVSISNNGSVAINVTAAAVSSAQFSVTGLSTPLALAAGQSAETATTQTDQKHTAQREKTRRQAG